jgi:sec-independent protein translocase protein TatA
MNNPVLLFFNLGGGEIFIIMVVILLFFGSKRIPDLAKGLGKGMREFKDAMNNVQKDIEDSTRVTDSESTGSSKTDKADKQ